MEGTPPESRELVTVLHIPYTYAPDPVGGTEVYVSALVRELNLLGVSGVVGAPGRRNAAYEVDEVPVRRFTPGPILSADDLAGAGDPVASRALGEILDDVCPDVLHLHSRTPAVSLRSVREARRRDIPVVYTYHTPTGTCPRGTLMRWGHIPCDGLLDVTRCVACVLHAHGVPRSAASALAVVPGLHRLPARGRISTATQMRRNVASAHSATQGFLTEVNHVVVPCEWSYALLRRLGVEPERLTMSRQGLPHDPPPSMPKVSGNPDRAMRVVFVGRLDSTKGLDTLLAALALRPDLNVVLDVIGVSQEGAERPEVSDSRIRLRPPLQPEEVVPALRQYDLLAVPSRCLETGPLVVLEAFAAGLPVLGSRLGGIAELVEDGVNGLLVEPEDPIAWANALARLEADRTLLSRLGNGVVAPRRMADAASDMATLYGRLLISS